MTELKEVNRIIGVFMGEEIHHYEGEWVKFVDHNFGDLWDYEPLTEYTYSLDLCAEVWKKLDVDCPVLWTDSGEGKEGFQFGYDKDDDVETYYSEGDTIQEAAARSTAKAIEDLKNRNLLGMLQPAFADGNPFVPKDLQ